MELECARCKVNVNPDDLYNYHGQDLCEDCYMGAMQAPKTCDVAATHLAKQHRQAAGQTGTEGLLEIQKEIYELIKRKGRVSRAEVMAELDLPEWELNKQVAVLRHCELVKGRKDEDGVFLVLFDQ
jgi:recombinational DNA repair protein (RecF pathway)